MLRPLIGLPLLTGLLFSLACDGPNDFDADLLAEYRRALPSKEVLKPGIPGSPSLMAAAVGEAAEYPSMGINTTQAIVDTIENMVEMLDNVTSTDPTVYNSDTSEFVWGPYAVDDDGVEDGQVLVYIKDHGEDSGEDFRYGYAFARGIGEDLSTYRPIIWGGANPDAENENHGSGITLWDFEANRAFADEHNPDHDFMTEGRFVVVYGTGPGDENPEATQTIVAATFRNFKDDEANQAADLDHLWGRFEADEQTVDFVSLEITADLFPEDTQGQTDAEVMNINMAFFNEGAGRAEVSIVGGELDTSDEVSTMLGEECWDPALNRLYFDLTAITPNGDEVTAENEGAELDCGFFALSLDTLNIPTLESIDPAHRAALAEVAENGINPEG